MTSTRDDFLQRVREALAAGNRAGDAAPLPERGSTGYQGTGPNPAARFCAELAAAGGHAHRATDDADAARQVLDLVAASSARRILLGRGPVLDRLALAGPLRDRGLEVVTVDSLSPDASRDAFFAADLGITGVAHLIAETGSLVVESGPDRPRSPSLLPPVHIAVADTAQLLPDLFDLFDPRPAGSSLPSNLTLITGPSKTGDIELRLVTGVHGPGVLHVVLIGS
jgi:L-lactate dehydrogenase complex protein LldG